MSATYYTFNRLAIGAALLGSVAFAERHSGTISLEPQVYSDSSQFIVGAAQRIQDADSRYPWLIEIRGEMETSRSRRSGVFDIERAWVRTTLDEMEWGELTFGRIHPWEVSLNPNSFDPWGLAASLENRRFPVSLGAADPNRIFPSPVLDGWIGVHYWSDPVALKPFQWGLSATPLYREADLGGKITLPTESSQWSVKPQVMGQVYWDLGNAVRGLENWAFAVYAPDFVSESSVHRIWLADTVLWTPPQLGKHSLFSTFSMRGGEGRQGIEIGAQNPYLKISAMHETKVGAGLDSRYADRLIQWQGQYPIGNFSPYLGAKHHLYQRNSWIRAGLKGRLASRIAFDLGTDLFVAPVESATIYGDAVDRVFANLAWDIGP